MKIKVVVVDFELSPRVKRWAVRLGIPALVLFAFGALAFGSVKHTFQPGEVLTAADLNENFRDLDARIPSKAALVPTSFFLPSFVQVGSAAAYTDDYRVSAASVNAVVFVYDVSPGGQWDDHDLATDGNAITGVTATAKIGAYLYALVTTSDSRKLGLYRLDSGNLDGGGTWMSPQNALGTLPSTMITDGSSLYVNNSGGTAAGPHVWRKYTFSDTALSYTPETEITVGIATTFARGAAMDSQGNFYGLDGTCTLSRYKPDGSAGVTAKVSLGAASNCSLAVLEGMPYLALNEIATHGYLAYLRAPLLP